MRKKIILFIIILCLLSGVMPVNAVSYKTINGSAYSQVQDSQGDSVLYYSITPWSETDNFIYLQRSTAETYCGLVFNLTIPSNATIKTAYISVYSMSSNTYVSSNNYFTTVYMSELFNQTGYNGVTIKNVNYSQGFVTCNLDDMVGSGWYMLDDISSLLNEYRDVNNVVNDTILYDVMLLNGMANGLRGFEAYDNNASRAPKLVVTYEYQVNALSDKTFVKEYNNGYSVWMDYNNATIYAVSYVSSTQSYLYGLRPEWNNSFGDYYNHIVFNKSISGFFRDTFENVDGVFYYLKRVSSTNGTLVKSVDGGVSWSDVVVVEDALSTFDTGITHRLLYDELENRIHVFYKQSNDLYHKYYDLDTETLSSSHHIISPTSGSYSGHADLSVEIDQNTGIIYGFCSCAYDSSTPEHYAFSSVDGGDNWGKRGLDNAVQTQSGVNNLVVISSDYIYFVRKMSDLSGTSDNKYWVYKINSGEYHSSVPTAWGSWSSNTVSGETYSGVGVIVHNGVLYVVAEYVDGSKVNVRSWDNYQNGEGLGDSTLVGSLNCTGLDTLYFNFYDYLDEIRLIVMDSDGDNFGYNVPMNPEVEFTGAYLPNTNYAWVSSRMLNFTSLEENMLSSRLYVRPYNDAMRTYYLVDGNGTIVDWSNDIDDLDDLVQGESIEEYSSWIDDNMNFLFGLFGVIILIGGCGSGLRDGNFDVFITAFMIGLACIVVYLTW